MTMIKGVLGKKLGMTQIFLEGKAEAVTAVLAGPCVVAQVKTMEKDGYEAVKLAFGETKKTKSSQKGELKDVGSFRHLREVRTDNVKDISVGDRVDASIFKIGDVVKVSGISRGRGFTGVIKRHGFHGGPKTHGQSDRHRAPGSIGAGSSPGRVWKGTKMAGHMGNGKVTISNLKVTSVDSEKNLLILKGSIPGGSNGLIMIEKTKEKIDAISRA
jgi:large subunit ribosomal protein L3